MLSSQQLSILRLGLVQQHSAFCPRQRGRRRSLSHACTATGGVQWGVHANVWEGAWSKEEAERAIAGTAAAGYDLIESIPRPPPPYPLPAPVCCCQSLALTVAPMQNAVNVSDPASVDPAMTAALLDANGITATGSLVRLSVYSQCSCCSLAVRAPHLSSQALPPSAWRSSRHHPCRGFTCPQSASLAVLAHSTSAAAWSGHEL